LPPLLCRGRSARRRVLCGKDADPARRLCAGQRVTYIGSPGEVYAMIVELAKSATPDIVAAYRRLGSAK
jgi:hypothetical protein